MPAGQLARAYLLEPKPAVVRAILGSRGMEKGRHSKLLRTLDHGAHEQPAGARTLTIRVHPERVQPYVRLVELGLRQRGLDPEASGNGAGSEEEKEQLAVWELETARAADAAALLSEAFLDYPAFLAFGPQLRAFRRRLIRSYYPSRIAVAHRFGGRVLTVWDEAGLAGVAIVFDPCRHEQPGGALGYQA